MTDNFDYERANKICKSAIDSIGPENIMRKLKESDVGRYVVTGPCFGSGMSKEMSRVGYIVQVREKAGSFGTDLVFIRHLDGSLVTHENQFFYSVSKYIENSLKKISVNKPEDEDYEEEYSIDGEYGEAGKFIKFKESIDTGLNSSTNIPEFKIKVYEDKDLKEEIIIKG